MKNLTWQNPEQLFVAQELINKVKSKCCGIKDHQKSRTQCLKSSFFGLLVPYFITCGVALGVSLVLSMENSHKIFFGTLGVSSEWFASNAMVGYGGNGPLWFLMALFWCRIIYDALRRIITNKWLFGGGDSIFIGPECSCWK